LNDLSETVNDESARFERITRAVHIHKNLATGTDVSKEENEDNGNDKESGEGR